MPEDLGLNLPPYQARTILLQSNRVACRRQTPKSGDKGLEIEGKIVHRWLLDAKPSVPMCAEYCSENPLAALSRQVDIAVNQ